MPLPLVSGLVELFPKDDSEDHNEDDSDEVKVPPEAVAEEGVVDARYVGCNKRDGDTSQVIIEAGVVHL